MADAGDARAACRLAYELDRCRRLPLLESGVKNAEVQVTRARDQGRDTSAVTRFAERVEREYSRVLKVCADFPIEDTAQAWQYSLAAAQQGYGPAIMNFLGGRVGLDTVNPLNTAEGWLAYKQFGPSLLQQALDQGIPLAYEFAAANHAWTESGRRIVPFDPVRSVAIYTALRTVATNDYKVKLTADIDAVVERTKLSPADLAKANADAAVIAAQIAKKNTGPFQGNVAADPGASCNQDLP